MTSGYQPPPERDEPAVLYEKKGAFARITLNRPDVLDAINQAVLRGLNDALDQATADDEVRSVILIGAGRAFSSGGDLSQSSRRAVEGAEAPAPDPDAPAPITQPEVFLKIWNLPKPVIAAVRGYAVGAGCELMMMCDIAMAEEGARIGEPQIRHGFGPPVLILPWIVGMRRAKDLLFTGDLMDANEAKAIGLVTRVAAAGTLDEEAEKLAERLAAIPAAALRLDKALLNRTFEIMGLLPGLNYRSQPAYADLFDTAMNDDETKARLRVLQERGWEAFIKERNAPHEAR
ncbi:MAG: enoyl-CoA hydratase/isomerase family protein [Chloroflexi bacterium]|nr:enoyl-CoA hydratase/isomerase family protein [Chloroflexota bacterium]